MSDPAAGGGQAFLTFHGKIQEPDVPALRRHVSAALEGQPHDLVIDMRDVWSLCDEAVAVLAGMASRQRSQRRVLTLVFSAGSPTDDALRRTRKASRFNTVRSIPNWSSYPTTR
jgi:hypothetical protein